MQERNEEARVRASGAPLPCVGNGAETGADLAIPQAGVGGDLYAAGVAGMRTRERDAEQVAQGWLEEF